MLRILFFLPILISVQAFGNISDSLRAELLKNDRIDTGLVLECLAKLDERIFSGGADSADLEFAHDVLKQSGRVDYPKGEILAHQKIGILHQYYFGNSIKAVEEYNKALEIINLNPQLSRYAYSSKSNTAAIYAEQEQFRKALNVYFDLHEDYPEQNIDQYIGKIYGELNENDSAITFFRNSVLKAQNSKNVQELTNTYVSLALMYQRSAQLDEARVAIDSGLALTERYQLDFLKGPAYMNAAMIYMDLDELELAKEYSEKALTNPYTAQNLYLLKAANLTSYEILKRIGDYEGALLAHEQYVHFQDSITKDEQKLEIDRLIMQSKFDQKEAQLEIKEFKYQIFFAGLIALIFGLGVLAFFYIRSFRQAARLRLVKSEKDLLTFKLSALRSKLNPHFIFNALVSLEHSIKENGIEKAKKYLIEFSKLLRAFLEHAEPGWITLDKELKIIENYVEIEQLRFEQHVQFNIEISPNIDRDDVMVPALFMQPIVENSIQHGLNDNQLTNSIRVFITQENQELITRITDNGSDSSIKSQLKNESIGLNLVKETIAILTEGKGEFTEGHLNEGGYETIIRIPLKTKF